MSHRRVLVVGFDAADGELAMRWLREGRLPTLAALAARGTAVPLRSQGEHMPESSWASLITGASPGEHGIYSWRIVRPGSVEQARMAEGGWMRPFWSVLRDHAAEPKPKVIIFDVPYSGGLQDDEVVEVGGWGLRVTRQGTSWPRGLFEELSSRHPAHPAWINRDYDRGPVSERRYRRVLRDLTRRRTRLILDLFGRSDWDLAVVNYVEPHFAGHAYHHHIEAAEPARRRARWGAPTGLFDLYAEADRNLGLLIDAAGPETDVVVVSTIGLRPNETSKDLLGRVLVALGYQVPAPRRSAGRTRARAMALAAKVVPRVLRHRVRKLVPTGATEAIADRAWGESIDWSRSRAVSEAEPGSAWLRFNLEGREPEGIVTPAEREALLAEIVADLGQLTDSGTGERAVVEVIPVADLAPGSRVAQMPDVLVRWAPGKRIRSVHHPRVGNDRRRRRPLRAHRAQQRRVSRRRRTRVRGRCDATGGRDAARAGRRADHPPPVRLPRARADAGRGPRLAARRRAAARAGRDRPLGRAGVLTVPPRRQRLIVMAPTPPPIFGHSVLTLSVLASLRRLGLLAAHVDTRDDRSLDNLNRLDVENVRLGLLAAWRLRPADASATAMPASTCRSRRAAGGSSATRSGSGWPPPPAGPSTCTCSGAGSVTSTTSRGR